MDDIRALLSKNIVSLLAPGHSRQVSFDSSTKTGTYLAADADIYCPHCFAVIVRQTFSTNELFTCTLCKTSSRFIVWSKTKDGKAYHAALSVIN